MIRPHCLVPSDFMPLNALRISDCSASSQMPILACLLVFLTQNSFNSCLEIHRLLNTLGILDCLIFTLLAVACPFFLAFLLILLMQDSFNSCLQIYRHTRSWDIGNPQAWRHWVSAYPVRRPPSSLTYDADNFFQVHTLHHTMSEAGDTTMCMSCGGEFPLGPGDPCTKCQKIKAAGSESEREAVIVSDMNLIHLLFADMFLYSGCRNAVAVAVPSRT